MRRLLPSLFKGSVILHFTFLSVCVGLALMMIGYDAAQKKKSGIHTMWSIS